MTLLKKMVKYYYFFVDNKAKAINYYEANKEKM